MSDVPEGVRQAIADWARSCAIKANSPYGTPLSFDLIPADSRIALAAVLLRGTGSVVVPEEPTEAMYEAWRSVNCTRGGDGMEEFTSFNGDYGNWLACHQVMLAASPTPPPIAGETGDVE